MKNKISERTESENRSYVIKNRKAREYYHSYENEKTSYTNFIRRVHKMGLSFEEAISPELMQPKKIKHQELRSFYHEYDGVKAVDYNQFCARIIRLGRSKEKAINTKATSFVPTKKHYRELPPSRAKR